MVCHWVPFLVVPPLPYWVDCMAVVVGPRWRWIRGRASDTEAGSPFLGGKEFMRTTLPHPESRTDNTLV
uniref:Putative secreted protein n=1 Tax=Anopheles darlingi TaxID=43151 RepID=A0A2M4DBF7_ANODA